MADFRACAGWTALALLVCFVLAVPSARSQDPRSGNLPEDIRKKIEASRGNGDDDKMSAAEKARALRRERARAEAQRRREARRKAAEARAAALKRAAGGSSAPSTSSSSRSSGSSNTSYVGRSRSENEGNPTFSLTPIRQVCRIGDQIQFDLHLENPSSTLFNSLSVTLDYDPDYLRPVGEYSDRVNDETEDKKAIRLGRDPATGYLNYIDQDEGLIRYAGGVPNNGVMSVGGYIWSVTFEAIAPTVLGKDTLVQFDFAPRLQLDRQHNPAYEASVERGTYLARSGKDKLGDPLVPDDGALDSSVFVSDTGHGTDMDREVFTFVHATHEEDEEAVDNETQLCIELQLPEGKEHIQVGDVFDMVVRLENPGAVEYNRIALFLAYNKRVLRALDYDQVEGEGGEAQGSWIQHGVNILDGPYHTSFPFNMFVENEVRRERGLIVYEVGNQRAILSNEGVFARLRFEALAPTVRTRIKTFFNREGEPPTTGVFMHSLDALGDSLDHTDGVTSEEFMIFPAPPQAAVAVVE